MRRLIAGLALGAVLFTGTAAPVSAAPSPNIVDRLIQLNRETGDFDVLLILALCPTTGGAVIDVLDGPETRTLFAPTDQAFGAAGLNGILEAAYLCAVADPEAIIALLAYHVVDARVTYDDVRNAVGGSITMLTGYPAFIGGTRSRPTIQDARIVRRNVKASNGLIQVVDLPLIPSDPCPPMSAGPKGSIGATC